MITNIIAAIAALLSVYSLLNKSSVKSRTEAAKTAEINTYLKTIETMEKSIKFYEGQEGKIIKLESKLRNLEDKVLILEVSNKYYKVSMSCRAECDKPHCPIIDKYNELTE